MPSIPNSRCAHCTACTNSTNNSSGGMSMRVVALEEHFTAPHLSKRIDPAVIKARGFIPRKVPKDRPDPMALLPAFGEQRLKSMDDTGIDVQVLSAARAGPDLVPGADGVALARELSDYLAETCAKHPTRFKGFAALPLQSGEACGDELVRCVKQLGFVGALINGTTEGRFLDHASYDSLLAAAVELDVPIYIHPHIPPPAVREAYYSGLDAGSERVIST